MTMLKNPHRTKRFALITLATALGCSLSSWAAPNEAVRAQVQQQKQPLLETLKDLVAIESGSGDLLPAGTVL